LKAHSHPEEVVQEVGANILPILELCIVKVFPILYLAFEIPWLFSVAVTVYELAKLWDDGDDGGIRISCKVKASETAVEEG